MKKISLKNLDIFGMEKLSKDDLKKVIGGNIANCGHQAQGASCPNGTCCSNYGFCGTGYEYCGDGKCQQNCDGEGGGDNCKVDALGFCAANCKRANGAASKCAVNGAGKCTCGGT